MDGGFNETECGAVWLKDRGALFSAFVPLVLCASSPRALTGSAFMQGCSPLIAFTQSCRRRASRLPGLLPVPSRLPCLSRPWATVSLPGPRLAPLLGLPCEPRQLHILRIISASILPPPAFSLV